MAKPDPAVHAAYQEMLRAVRAYVDAAIAHALASRSPVSRSDASAIAERIATLLQPGETRSLVDIALALGFARTGVSRVLVDRAARKLVRSGRAAFADRKTAIRLRRRRVTDETPELTPEEVDLGDTLTPEQIARRDELMTWLIEQARLGRSADDVLDDAGDDPMFLEAYARLVGEERIAEDEERRLVVLPAPEAT